MIKDQRKKMSKQTESKILRLVERSKKQKIIKTDRSEKED
jgi:hypothetical protein